LDYVHAQSIDAILVLCGNGIASAIAIALAVTLLHPLTTEACQPLKLTSGRKAAQTRKWRRAASLAHRHSQNAKTFAKYELSKKGYKCISLDSKKGYEYKGVVDLVAVKRNRKNPDLLEVMLLQVKGGNAKITRDEMNRLRAATRNVKVQWNIAEKPGRTIRFRRNFF
jgi:hypothetical protein